MFRNYLKIAFRSILKNKAFSLINIIGLSIGLSSAFVIGAMIYYDMTFNRLHPDGERIYRVVTDTKSPEREGHFRGVPVPLGKALENEVAGIENVSMFFIANFNKIQVGDTEKIFRNPKNVIFAEGSYFNLLEYQWLAGSPEDVLDNPYEVVMTERRAEKYFPDTSPQEVNKSSLITAHASKMLQIKGFGKTIKNINTTPVGVVEDFNIETLKAPMQPTIIVAENEPPFSGALIRISPGTEKQVLASIHTLWEKFYPNKLLDIKWVVDMLNQQYSAEKKLRQLFAFFSVLTMFLAALGIFGLIVQSTLQRIKEIGIRKVLGASINSIVLLFSKDVLKLVTIAILVASPIAWYVLHRWLQGFAHRIDIHWWVFVLSGVIAILITLITISFQAVKTAMSNPAKVLRTE